jgi:hypothetical protein
LHTGGQRVVFLAANGVQAGRGMRVYIIAVRTGTCEVVPPSGVLGRFSQPMEGKVAVGSSSQVSGSVGYAGYDYDEERGGGWVAFAGVLLLILGTLNSIEGVAAIGNANFFVHNTHYVFGGLNTWGGSSFVSASPSSWLGLASSRGISSRVGSG